MTYIVCETTAAIVTHLRALSEQGAKYSGGADTLTLCGMKASWDTQLPLSAVTCGRCLELSKWSSS